MVCCLGKSYLHIFQIYEYNPIFVYNTIFLKWGQQWYPSPLLTRTTNK